MSFLNKDFSEFIKTESTEKAYIYLIKTSQSLLKFIKAEFSETEFIKKAHTYLIKISQSLLKQNRLRKLIHI